MHPDELDALIRQAERLRSDLDAALSNAIDDNDEVAIPLLTQLDGPSEEIIWVLKSIKTNTK